MANCQCGTTLALDCPSHGEMYEQFVAALRADARRDPQVDLKPGAMVPGSEVVGDHAALRFGFPKTSHN